MFYSQFILAKKGPLGTIWIAAHLERRLRKNQVADTDIGVSVDSIIFPEVPIALRLSSHLMVGVVRIYSRKVNYLFHDCSEALLKIKQAFRSTAVDLPPEESSAPYHSITLPETFHLDDFELPETAFQGDIDHHVSTKEQITLQDNPERTGYSTSQFGLDERFGDDNSSHIGLDLEEELLLNKDHSIQLVSDVGIMIQGQPSVPPTDMDVDDNQSKDGYNERYNNADDGPSSHSKFNPSNTDDLGRNSVPNWNCYNIKTPDLNEMFFHNGDVAGPSASYHQPSPFPGHEPTSPEFVSAQAPATPGLMEETVPSSVHESPVPSPQRKSSSSNNDRTAKADNSVAPVSVFPHSTSANGNDVMGTAMTEPGLANPVQLDSSGTVQEADSLRQQCANEDLQFQVASQDGTPSSIHFVETSSLEAPVDKFVMDTEICKSLSILPNDNLAGSDENEAVKATAWDNGPSSKSTSELCATVTENLAQINETSVDVQGHNLHVANATETNADLHQSIREMIPDGIPRNDKSIDLSISEFPEPEKMLLAAHIKTHEANDSWQITAEKVVTESDGSNKIGTLSSRKRRLEDSLPAVETGSPEKLSSRPQGRRTTDIIPDDDDLLASILVGKRTPGLRLGSTPLPPKVTSLKRPRIASKMVTCKRKVQMDDAVVLHADIIRQQLISVEDIRRIRKKAPCTRSEVWMIEKGSLEDEIFDEPTLSCASEELNNLHYRMYETVMHLTTQRIELQGRPDMAEAEAQDRNIGGASSAKDNPTLDHLPHTGSPNGAQSCALEPEATNAHHATAASGWSIRPEGQVDNESEALAGDTVSQGVIEPLVGSENGAKTVHNSATAGLISIPADFQKSVNIDTPLFVLDDNIPGADVNVPPDSAIGMKYAEVSTQDAVLDSSGPTYVVGNMNEELEKGVLGNFNASENKEMPTSVITEVESTQEASGFPQPTTDENAVSAMGENSGLQENNFGSFMDLDSMGHDFAPKECSDFGSAIHGVDTDFLNYDDEVDYDEADNDEPNPGEFQSLDNSGWSSRTRGVARYLKTLFDEESGLGRKSVVVDHLVSGKTRKEASRMFFETLVLKTKDYIQVEQPNPFDFVTIKPGIKLMKSDF